MPVLGKARETIESAASRVASAAADTRRSIVALGAGLLFVALIAVAALILGVRRRPA